MGAETREVMLTKSRLLRERSGRTWDSSHCKRTRVFQLCRAGLGYVSLSHNIAASPDVFSIFGHVTAVDVLHEYTGYMTQVVETT